MLTMMLIGIMPIALTTQVMRIMPNMPIMPAIANDVIAACNDDTKADSAYNAKNASDATNANERN